MCTIQEDREREKPHQPLAGPLSCVIWQKFAMQSSPSVSLLGPFRHYNDLRLLNGDQHALRVPRDGTRR